MSKKSRRKLCDSMYDVLEEMWGDITPSEIYGVLETIKMDAHDGAVEKIKKEQ